MAEAPAAGFDIRRILLIAGVILVVLFASLFFLFRSCAPAMRGGGGYTIVYSNLDLKDAANVVARLKELAVPYEVRDEGKAIAVPKDKVDQARLGLAEKNLPAGGVVGWEIFDEAKLGATDFDRRIQLIRAISGELSRTIRKIQAVEDVRVQIVLPETRLFAATTAPVTASVLLRLRPGAELSHGKITGIIHLVASSVENLQPENVTVIDNTGRILSAEKEIASFIEATRQQLLPTPEVSVVSEEVVVASLEAASPEAVAAAAPRPLTVEERILLKVQAKKELETDLTGKAQEILNHFYPPNSVIVKVNVDLENSPSEVQYKKHELTIDRISTVILVDNRVDLGKELKESTFKAVAAAIGYSRKRGDRILLQKVPFHLATPPPAVMRGEVEKVLPPITREKAGVSLGGPNNIVWLLGAAGLVVLLFLFFKAFRRPAAGVPEKEMPEVSMPASPKQDSVLARVKALAERNPERIAELLRSWLTG